MNVEVTVVPPKEEIKWTEAQEVTTGLWVSDGAVPFLVTSDGNFVRLRYPFTVFPRKQFFTTVPGASGARFTPLKPGTRITLEVK